MLRNLWDTSNQVVSTDQATRSRLLFTVSSRVIPYLDLTKEPSLTKFMVSISKAYMLEIPLVQSFKINAARWDKYLRIILLRQQASSSLEALNS